MALRPCRARGLPQECPRSAPGVPLRAGGRAEGTPAGSLGDPLSSARSAGHFGENKVEPHVVSLHFVLGSLHLPCVQVEGPSWNTQASASRTLECCWGRAGCAALLSRTARLECRVVLLCSWTADGTHCSWQKTWHLPLANHFLPVDLLRAAPSGYRIGCSRWQLLLLFHTVSLTRSFGRSCKLAGEPVSVHRVIEISTGKLDLLL